MSDQRYYECRSRLIPARRYGEVWRIAWRIFKAIKAKTKRRPYIRSAYFKGNKIFFENFWLHLNEKHPNDRLNRLKYFECAIELIQKSKVPPLRKMDVQSKKEILYRFMGKIENRFFAVQIKEDTKRKQRFLMSIFGIQK